MYGRCCVYGRCCIYVDAAFMVDTAFGHVICATQHLAVQQVACARQLMGVFVCLVQLFKQPAKSAEVLCRHDGMFRQQPWPVVWVTEHHCSSMHAIPNAARHQNGAQKRNEKCTL